MKITQTPLRAPEGATAPATPAGLSDALVSELAANPLLTETPAAPAAKPPAESGGTTPPAETPEQKTAREAAEAEAATPAAAKSESKLSSDQEAWLKLRAEAKTDDEAKALDAQAPAFTDDEWKLAETQFAPPAAGAPSTDIVATFSPEQKTYFETQVKAATEAAAAAKAEADAQAKRLAEIQAELTAAKAQPVAVANVHPLFLADATQLDKAEADATAFKEWALKNWDGSPAVEAAGNEPAQPAHTAEQVRAAYARADKQLSQIIPSARQALANHIAASVQAKAVYPEMFEPNTPAAQTTEAILRQLPGLKAALPNAHLVIGDASLGEIVRQLVYAEKPTPEAVAAAQALVKAAPSLAKFMPQLSSVTKAGGKPAMRLPAKPIVPLARPAPAGGSSFRGPKPPTKPAPSAKKFHEQMQANGNDTVAALTQVMAQSSTD